MIQVMNLQNFTVAQRLLVWALRDSRTKEESDELRALYGELGDDGAWDAAGANKVSAIVGHALMEVLARGEVPARWVTVHAAALRRTTAFINELDRLASLLHACGVAVAVIENGGVACAGFHCLGCFCSGDMDVLVVRSNLDEVDACLACEGYEHRTREGRIGDDWAGPDSNQRGWRVYFKQLDSAAPFFLNVMWRPILRRWLPAGDSIPASVLLARSAPIDGRPTFLHVLSPEDNLLQCALHTASHSYVRGPGLRLQLDVDRLVRHARIDWNLFLERARQYRVCARAFASLALPRILFRTPVPERILYDLLPSTVRQTSILQRIARAGLFHGQGRQFGSGELFLFETLLDDAGHLAGFTRALFPPVSWVREGWRASAFTFPYSYSRRLWDLMRRTHLNQR